MIGTCGEPTATALFYSSERLPALLADLGRSPGGGSRSSGSPPPPPPPGAEEDVDDLVAAQRATTAAADGEDEADSDEVIIVEDDDEGASGSAEKDEDAAAAAAAAEGCATVLFVDIGHAGTTAAVFSFDASGDDRGIVPVAVASTEAGGTRGSFPFAQPP